MANPNGRKGAQYETDVMRWFREHEAVAERLTKAGAKDEGDLYVFLQGKTYIMELKNRKKLDLPAFWDEAQVEARRMTFVSKQYEFTPMVRVIHKRYFVEAGANLSGQLRFNFMYNY